MYLYIIYKSALFNIPTWTVDFWISYTDTHTRPSLGRFTFIRSLWDNGNTHNNNIHIVLYDQRKPTTSQTRPVSAEARIVSTANTPCNYYAIIAKTITTNANSRSVRIIIPAAVLFARFYFTIWRCRFPQWW